ncbi:MAG: TraR/DksA family transcriptional regulator [Hellea sp.]|nr:TraR/DksA family transcriptional regulator [Hellea sp.]
METSEQNKYKQILTARRDELMQRLEKIEVKFTKSGDAPLDSDSPPVRNLATLQEKDELAESEIKAINAALERVQQGHFGSCVMCGDDIDQPRLDAVPHTPFCSDHAP